MKTHFSSLTKPFVLSALIAIAFLGGCGGNDDDDDSQSVSSTSSSSSSASSSSSSAESLADAGCMSINTEGIAAYFTKTTTPNGESATEESGYTYWYSGTYNETSAEVGKTVINNASSTKNYYVYATDSITLLANGNGITYTDNVLDLTKTVGEAQEVNYTDSENNTYNYSYTFVGHETLTINNETYDACRMNVTGSFTASRTGTVTGTEWYVAGQGAIPVKASYSYAYSDGATPTSETVSIDPTSLRQKPD